LLGERKRGCAPSRLAALGQPASFRIARIQQPGPVSSSPDNSAEICTGFLSSSLSVRFRFCYGSTVNSLDPNREIYPNAPLKLVTFEFRFAPIELLPATIDRLAAGLRDRYPIRGPALQQFVIGPAGASTSSGGIRLFDQPRQQAVTFENQRIVFETSRYHRFEELRDAIARVLGVVDTVDLVLVPIRVGLRYIDEIDEALLPEPGAWTRYISPALSSPLQHFDPAPQEHQSAALFEGSEGRNVVLRYGLMRQPAVDPTGALVIEAPPAGPYYLIDIDSAWQGQEDATPLAEWLLGKLDDLHSPIRHLFETSITDDLRNEVLRKETTP
jgi:uncharacterized protein (TIGR04255 family)